MPFEEGLVDLSRQACLALIAQASVGRIGVSVDALPAVVPVWIAVMDESIVFRTVPGTKLAYAATGSVLAVEADDYEPSRYEGWSVLVRGIASELAAPEDIARARGLLGGSWIDGAVEHYVRVSCDLVTGRRVRHPPRSDPSLDVRGSDH